MSRNGSAVTRTVMMALVAALLGGTAAPAMADDEHDRDRHEEHDRGEHRGWDDRDRHEHERRYRDWRDHGRVYYGERTYVDPPPPVVYGPPPPPPGIDFIFSLGR